jgi:hypothetical protein
MKLFVADFEITAGEKEYVVHHAIRADNIDEAEEIALFWARDFWGQAETAKCVNNEGDNFGWYGPDGDEAISYEGMTETTPEGVVRALEIRVDSEKFDKLKTGK